MFGHVVDDYMTGKYVGFKKTVTKTNKENTAIHSTNSIPSVRSAQILIYVLFYTTQ